MHVQPRLKPDDGSKFFQDGRADRPEIPDTVARGQMRTDELLYTGRVNGAVADQFPFPVTRQVLERGRARFNIYCSPCRADFRLRPLTTLTACARRRLDISSRL
jgi:hypothetical protein